MKMKKFLLVGLLGVVTLCGLSSCDDDDDGGYVPFSYAVGDMVVKDGSEPYIQLDSKQTLFPSNGSRLPNYLLKDGKRVIVKCSHFVSVTPGTEISPKIFYMTGSLKPLPLWINFSTEAKAH